MRLGIMQPYLLPYAEHFRLLAACDRWVVFDTVGYRRRTWMTRNRVANRDRPEGWTWMSLPVTPTGRDQAVREVPVDHGRDWRGELLGRLGPYRVAPHHAAVMAVLEEALDDDLRTLVDVDEALLVAVARRLGIETPVERLSDLGLDLPDGPGPGEWALFIADALGADEYRNPSGGRHLFDPDRFARLGIELSFHVHADLTYDPSPFPFVPDLSVVDPLMWLGWDEMAAWVRR